MTNKEIITALGFCSDDEAACDLCPYYPHSERVMCCSTNMMRDTLRLITCQKSQIEDLSVALYERLQRIKELEAEVERLGKLRAEALKEVERQYEQAEANILANTADGGTSCHWCIDKHRNATIREFAAAAKDRIVSDFLNATGGENTAQSLAVLKVLDILKEVKKEMTEDTDNV